ncbi:glycosyltransferase [Pseudoalteromonas luteoviolacea]|uniref:Uncharacterized protein n=1 Tax=Pseudoalteromonas luteoviolacea S4060-1 TaxID=1365257 RepID=A0A167MEF4_9GAMM|nr:glycosyltransferase [Pseudoalteromonas luteoviolacea]KZN66258.1 hypothetical protein N478_20290 [Pseudoalteromonas luteoviolacea S4060-1]
MKSMTIGHILLTRFSYRQNPEDHAKQTADVFLRQDPLNPEALDFRFALFECACLPNVLAQTNQDFDWVLIIDPDLPKKYRDRLEALIAKRDRTHLHEFRRDDLGSLGWLEQYMSSNVDFALTTNLDDDDIITIDYIERLQTHVKGLGESAPSLKFFGIKSTYQWDLFSSTKYPFGTVAPWHRTNYFKSTGLSMLCKVNAHKLTVYSLPHHHGDIWYATGSEQEIEGLARKEWSLSKNEPCRVFHITLSNFQDKLEQTPVAEGHDWKSLPSSALHYDFSDEGVFAVHLNHFSNDQATRLFEHKQGIAPVTEAQFFPNDVRINWDVFQKHRNLFEVSSERYQKFLQEISSYSKKLNLNWWQSILLIVGMRTKLAWWFFRN